MTIALDVWLKEATQSTKGSIAKLADLLVDPLTTTEHELAAEGELSKIVVGFMQSSKFTTAPENSRRYTRQRVNGTREALYRPEEADFVRASAEVILLLLNASHRIATQPCAHALTEMGWPSVVTARLMSLVTLKNAANPRFDDIRLALPAVEALKGRLEGI